MTGNLHSSTREAPQDEGTRFILRMSKKKSRLSVFWRGKGISHGSTPRVNVVSIFSPLYLLLRLRGPSILVRSRLTNLQRGLPIRAAISAQLLCTPGPAPRLLKTFQAALGVRRTIAHGKQKSPFAHRTPNGITACTLTFVHAGQAFPQEGTLP